MPKPYPIPDELSQPFWEAANRGELVIQRCRSCRRYQHPPAALCLSCGGADVAYEPVSGRGTVHSYTIVHDARARVFQELQPYPVVIVELAEQPELFLLTNLPGARLDAITTGMPVAVEFEQVTPEQAIPQFHPAQG